MKRTGLALLFILGMTFCSNAQISLPYTNGFDNNSQNADWVAYRKGLTTIDGNPNHEWEPYASAGAVTAPNYLLHDYPVGYTGTQMTDDWLVSKSINFTNGAKLSLKAWIYSISDIMPGDSIELYLLKNSQDPATATKIKIASLRSMVVSTGSMNAPTWKDTANIVIPAATGNAYLAIRYTCINNWYTVALDNLKLIANPTGIADVEKGKISFRLYPNPATSVLQWQIAPNDLQQHAKEEGVIVNYTGQELKRFRIKDSRLDISSLQPGMYYVRIGASMMPFSKL
jgi:hypothetical protein